MKRIFTAIDVPDKVRLSISEYTNRLRSEFSDLRVGREKPEKIHLTLNFLGEVDPRQLSDVTAVTRTIASETGRFDLTAIDGGVFPNPRNPRILWIGLQEETGILNSVKSRLDEGFQKMGFAARAGRFVPHLTIGRLRQPGKSKELARVHRQNRFGPCEFGVSQLNVYESELNANGSIYHLLDRAPFRDS